MGIVFEEVVVVKVLVVVVAVVVFLIEKKQGRIREDKMWLCRAGCSGP